MVFTREDILKILNALLQLGRKDSEFKDANTPLNSDDYIAILQDGINKKVSINNLLSTLGLLKKDDFINVSDRYDEYYIQLSEAITIIANNKRKRGLVITFQDINGNWRIYQFTDEVSNFIKTEHWKDLFDFKYPIINTVLPDEEDLTLTYPNIEGNSFILLKDKEYDPENFSGMATKILRKSIVEVNGIKKNILILNDFDLENCIYEIRYDFDLNSEEVTIPEGCVLDFKGGSFTNGKIKGRIKNEYIMPEWFGAKGDKVTDDSNAFKVMMDYAFNYKSVVKLKHSAVYKLVGDNPMGLPYIQNEDSENIAFYDEFTDLGISNRSRFRLNLEGNNALILWQPTKVDDCLAFVGYLRNSVWENFQIATLNNSINLYGNIFSTFFHVPYKSHCFSTNIFRNISISGGCNRVFNFERDETGDEIPEGTINPSGAHDDLSIFENINAGQYNVFCYIKNAQAVANTFVDCKINCSIDNSIGFYITGSQKYNSWAGGLRIQNIHYTVEQALNTILVKEDTRNVMDRIVYVTNPRMEVVLTNYTKEKANFRYFDINSIHLYMEGFTVINSSLPYNPNTYYGIVRGYENAKVTCVNCTNFITPIALYSGNYNKPMRFENCSFRVGTNIYDTSASPIIKYISYNGENEYNNIEEALASGASYPTIEVISAEKGYSQYRQSWNDTYNKYLGFGTSDVERSIILQKQALGGIGVDRSHRYVIPDDIIVTELSYTGNGPSQVKKVTLSIYDKEENEIMVITKVSNTASYQRFKAIPFIGKNEVLSLKKGYILKFSFFKSDNSITENSESSYGITEGKVYIKYRYPRTYNDIKMVSTTQIYSLLSQRNNDFSAWNEDGTSTLKVDII